MEKFMVGKILGGIWQFITHAKNATFNILFVVFLGFIVVGIFSSGTDGIPEQTALVIKPTGQIVEQRRPIDPMSQFIGGDDQEASETLLKDILDTINHGANDARVKVLVLDLESLAGAGFSKLEEIGKALTRFKTSGKPIYAFARRYSQGQYYLAMFADKVYLDKDSHQMLGGVFLSGMGVYPSYFKSALDKLKVDVHVYKVGTYKSAIEPYIRDDMSAAAKESNGAWLNELWAHYGATVSQQRGIDAESFERYTNQYSEVLKAAGSNPNQMALDNKLVDELISRRQWQEKLIDIAGNAEHDEGYNRISMNHYLTMTRPAIEIPNPATDKVAIITAKGVIYDGHQAPGDIGGDSIAELIKQARDDKSVKALVFRVDSPGGSASASEVIRSELVATKAAGKPIVVSMGTYAASGGYWVSASANKIFALETTITGSIGVFATLPTFENSLDELGIHSDGVGTTTMSGAFNVFNGVNPQLDSALTQGVNYTYDYFLKIVAEGRDLEVATVDKIAQGRVWTATAALKFGLIDAIGSEADAVEAAALLADLGNYDVLRIKKPLSPKEQFLQEILNNATAKSIGEAFQTQLSLPEFTWLQTLKRRLQPLLEMKPGVYVQCLECALAM